MRRSVTARLRTTVVGGLSPSDSDSSAESSTACLAGDIIEGPGAFADPIFRENDVAMKFKATIEVSSPRSHYDAAVLMPLAHRIPIPQVVLENGTRIRFRDTVMFGTGGSRPLALDALCCHPMSGSKTGTFGPSPQSLRHIVLIERRCGRVPGRRLSAWNAVLV